MTPADERAAGLLGALAGAGPAVVARAPGRVNVIGEHTDYNGLPVLPFAIERDVLVAARARDDGIVDLANRVPAYPPARFAVASPIAPSPPGAWDNYVKAAVQALLAAGVLRLPGGATLRVDGAIPPAAGVASSSALVVASAIAVSALAGMEPSPDPLELAQVLAEGEQYVGTLSGGMDQAAILLSLPGHVMRIDFFPLRARAIPLPSQAAFVVAHTLEEAAKAGVARGLYNQRVIECRLACAVLARRLGDSLERLGDLADPASVHDALPDLLPDGAVGRAELSARLGLRAPEVDRLVPPSVTLANPDRFVLRARVRHVLGEAMRVTAAEQALVSGDLAGLGALLDASHASAATDYGTSTPAADALVRLGRDGGALGGRLMGAGFGGAVLLLVARDRVPAVLAEIDRRFYGPRRDGADVRFAVRPSPGASVARVDCPGVVC